MRDDAEAERIMDEAFDERFKSDEWLVAHLSHPNTQDCACAIHKWIRQDRQAAFESGRQIKAGQVTRIIAELNDTWKELEHAGFTLLAAKVSTLAKELSNND